LVVEKEIDSRETLTTYEERVQLWAEDRSGCQDRLVESVVVRTL